MNSSDIGRSDQLRAERQAVETLYRAFSDQNPDLVDKAVTPDWKDIPLAPGQGLAELPVSRVAQLSPAAWVAAN